MQNLLFRISRFMYERNGLDNLNFFIFCCVVINAVVISVFHLHYGFTLFNLALLIVYSFRSFSKNLRARRNENSRFLSFVRPIRKSLTLIYKKITDRSHKYYRCPNCRKVIRVPRGKGKIKITCPHCQEKFDRKT